MRLFSSSPGFKFLMYAPLRASETNIFPGEYFKSNSYFCKRRKTFRHGVVVTSNLNFPIASNWGFSSLNLTSFFSRVRRERLL